MIFFAAGLIMPAVKLRRLVRNHVSDYHIGFHIVSVCRV